MQCPESALPPAGRRKGKAWEAELSKRMRALGTGIANLLKVFHPPLVILDGIYNDFESEIVPVLKEALREELEGLALSAPTLVLGEKVEFKTSIGAALRAADAFLEKHLLEKVFRLEKGTSGYASRSRSAPKIGREDVS